MRFLVISKRKPGVLKGATLAQAATHFKNVQSHFDQLKESGVLVEEGRLVGHHARFQIFDTAKRQDLDAVLSAAPNTPYVTRETYEVGSVHDAVERLCTKAGVTAY